MKTFKATTITMLENATGLQLVPAKSRKSDKSVIVRFGTSVSVTVKTNKR
jgi:hypothetical protein